MSASNFALDNGEEDIFNGVTLNLVKNPCDLTADEFAQQLDGALAKWHEEGRRGIWVHVPLAQAGLFLPALHAQGFQFHHCRATHCVLTTWLDKSCESGLPHFANHQVGVGGMVVNEHGEVLAIRERSGVTANLKGFWKLPGGLVDPRESIRDAAVRECKEETGIDTEFVALAAFRESQSGPFGTSDMYVHRYFVAVLRLSDSYAAAGVTRPEPSPDPHEIAACSWVPATEFLGSKWYEKSMYGDLLRAAFKAFQTGGGLGVAGEASKGKQLFFLERASL